MRLGSTVMRKTTGALTSFRRISLLEELLDPVALLQDDEEAVLFEELDDFTTLLELDFALLERLLDLTEELLDPVALL